MQFVYPEILFGLLALAIPIIVHLFNFRKFKRVVFSNVSFLKEVKQETQSKSRLKHLLILASRMLAIAAIVLAFAQPFIPVDDSDTSAGKKVVSLYIDNSFSMEAENEDGRLIDLARNQALEIVDAYQATDLFHVVTNDFEGRHQFLVNKDEVVELIDEIQISPTTRNISDVVARQLEALSQSDISAKTAYIISDLQKSTHDFETMNADTAVNFRLVPNVVVDQDNIFIDSVWFDSPVIRANATEQLRIRIGNTNSESIENIPLKLTIDGSQKAVASFSIEPGQYTDTTLFFTISEPGFHKAEVQIQDHPVTFDDSYYFSFEVAERINILEIGSGKTNFVRKVFEDDPYFAFTQVSSLGVDYSDLPNHELIILNELPQISSGLASELSKLTQAGGHVLLIPGKDVDLSSYNAFLSLIDAPSMGGLMSGPRKVSEINLDHFLYKDVFESLPKNIDLPTAQNFYSLGLNSRSKGDQLLTMQGGACFLGEFKSGEGRVYLSAVSLIPTESNFSQHALFVTSLVRIAEFAQRAHRLSYIIGKDELAETFAAPDATQEPFHLTDSRTGLDFLPDFRRTGGTTEIYLHGQPSEAGSYDLQRKEQTVDVFSFNYQRDESDLAFYSPSDANNIIQEMGATNFTILTGGLETLKSEVGELNDGKKLWPLFIILALLFLVIEIALIKLLK
jgi:hypothetical protein